MRTAKTLMPRLIFVFSLCPATLLIFTCHRSFNKSLNCTQIYLHKNLYSKTCLKLPLKNRHNKDNKDKWEPYEGGKYLYKSLYSKTCLKRPLRNRQNKDPNDKW